MKVEHLLERLNQELTRRTHVVRTFPGAASCLRLIRALAVEIHENWLEAICYLTRRIGRAQEGDAAQAGARPKPATAASGCARFVTQRRGAAKSSGRYRTTLQKKLDTTGTSSRG